MKAKKILSIAFITLGVGILCLCSYGALLDRNVVLNGVTKEEDEVSLNGENILNGKYQNYLETTFNENFPGRKTMIRFRNQFLYSVYGESSNENIVIGKDKYLFEPTYIYYELGIYKTEEKIIQDNIKKLEELKKEFEAAGKELYLFITPSKAHFCYDYIPEEYFQMKISDSNDYDCFVKNLKNSSLNYFDCHEYLEKVENPAISAPKYYPTGIHWSSSWGQSCAKAFLEQIQKSSKWNLGSVELKESRVSSPESPDADLYNSLNLVFAPSGKYYSSTMSVKEKGDSPSVFMRGGSFMGQSLNAMIKCGVFSNGIHYENGYVFKNMYTDLTTFSNVGAYDEYTDLISDLQKSDILILEINEAVVNRMTFGFLDYLSSNVEQILGEKR